MRRFVVGAGVLATLAAGALVVALPDAATLTVQAYSATLAALAAAVIVQILAATYDLAPRRPGARLKAAVRDPVAVELERLQRQVELGTTTAADVHAFLRPMLREIASRLLLLHGVDLDHEPRRARQLLGRDLWELVCPDRPRPAQPLASGLSRNELAAVLGRLEAL